MRGNGALLFSVRDEPISARVDLLNRTGAQRAAKGFFGFDSEASNIMENHLNHSGRARNGTIANIFGQNGVNHEGKNPETSR
jgi:hypothetical protein